MHHDDRERLVLLGERCARSGDDFEMHFRVLLGQGALAVRAGDERA